MRSAISVLGGLPGFLVFGGSPDASFPEVFLTVSSSAGLPDASFPEVLLDGLVLSGSSRRFVSGSSS